MSMDVFSSAPEIARMKKLVSAALLSSEMHPARVGERVAALRESLRMSKAEFADSIQLDRSTLTKVEAGNRGLDIAVGAKIAELYGAGLDFIYRGVLSDLPLELRPTVAAQIHAVRTGRIIPG